MSTLFKDLFSEDFYDFLSNALKHVLPELDKQAFITQIYCDEFFDFEMKQRISHTTQVLHQFMPKEFSHASDILIQLIAYFESLEIKPDSLEYLFIPEYIERYGLEDYDNAIKAFVIVTPFVTCEFAVRPFIAKYQQKMLNDMMLWATHDHRRVRRLASEGSRPRLPWGMALRELKKDPSPLTPILLELTNDSCEAVRRSVANSLNDIAKDNPDYVISFAKTHINKSEHTNKLIKHACRTLLKQANPEVLELFGFESKGIETSNFDITTPKVTIGSNLEFTFTVHNTTEKRKKLRLEYGLYYLKNNGTLARKVFKISERDIEAKEKYTVDRKQSFKLITTRKFYVGIHELSLILNGQELDKKEFELTT